MKRLIYITITAVVFSLFGQNSIAENSDSEPDVVIVGRDEFEALFLKNKIIAKFDDVRSDIDSDEYFLRFSSSGLDKSIKAIGVLTDIKNRTELLAIETSGRDILKFGARLRLNDEVGLMFLIETENGSDKVFIVPIKLLRE